MRLMWRYAILACAVAVTLVISVVYMVQSNFQNKSNIQSKLRQLSGRFVNIGIGPSDRLKDIFYKPGGNRTVTDLYIQYAKKRWGHVPPELAQNPSNVDKNFVRQLLRDLNVNVYVSDHLPLNRDVPESRPAGCLNIEYTKDLPTTSIVIPFHNEWPSVLLRTLHSLVHRTPKHLLKQIIIVDDASDLDSLKDDLDVYVRQNFPKGVVRILRMPERVGLIKARLEGFKFVTADVVSFMDSHMEVNRQWLEPLLLEVKKDRSTVAMGQLDYIHAESFQYDYRYGYKIRYGFDWRLIFFETYFRNDQLQDKADTDPLPGVVMVGPAFVINVEYFKEIGTYDSGMKIWGGENLELPWRVWLCGGKLVHVSCSKIGHIARVQPYSFPDGRQETEIHNYKRAVDVWMGDYKKYVYEQYPGMKDMDVGDLTERIKIKERLNCKPFDWLLENVWPELFPYDRDVYAWGGLQLQVKDMCLDNEEYLFNVPKVLLAKRCNLKSFSQMFSWTHKFQLRTILQCVVARLEAFDYVPYLADCMDVQQEQWQHTKDGHVHHIPTQLCLDLISDERLVLGICNPDRMTQVWRFAQYEKPELEPIVLDQRVALVAD